MTTISFKRSEAIEQIAAAMAKAQGQMGEVKKNKTAEVAMKAGGKYSYSYADIADVIEAMRIPLSSNGLALIQSLCTISHTDDHKTEETVGLVTLLMHESGQWMEFQLDTGLYASSPQDVGKSITYFKRYTLQSIGLIAGEADTDAQGMRNTQGRSQRPQAPERPRTAPRPMPDREAYGADDFPRDREPYPEDQTQHDAPEDRQDHPADTGAPTKGQKLAAWAERHGHTGRANALAARNYGCRVDQLKDADADTLYRLIADAKPVEPKGRPAQGATNANGNPVSFGWPSSGKALFAWAKNLEGAFNTSIVKMIDSEFGPGSRFGWPNQFVEWNASQVEQAARFVAKVCKTYPGYDGQFDSHVPDLKGLKALLRDRIGKLAAHLGQPGPSPQAVNEFCEQHSADLGETFGGELLTDLQTCDNADLLQAVLDSVTRDLAEADQLSS